MTRIDDGLKLVFLLVLLLALEVAAGRQAAAEWYAEIGVGLTRAEWARPEVDLPSPLIKGVIGVEGDYGWSIELEHISSAQKAEQGSGLNTLWITKRIRFQDSSRRR